MKIDVGDLVEISSSIGNLVKSFELYPAGDFIRNRAHWVDTRQIGTILETDPQATDNLRYTGLRWYKVLVAEGVLWIEGGNLRVLIPQ